MDKLRRIIIDNKLYVVLAVFLIAINIFVLFAKEEAKEVPQSSQEIIQEEEPLSERKVFDPDDIKMREEKIKRLAQEDPLLYLFIGILNLAIIFFVFLGLFFDMYLGNRFFAKKPINIRTNFNTETLWGIGDIIRVSLIFLSFGYLVVIVQSFIAPLVPIFYNENFRMVLNTALMNIVGISVMLYFVVRKYKQHIVNIGLTRKRFGVNILYGLVGYIALLPIIFSIMVLTMFIVKWLNYEPPVQPIVQVFMEEKETGILWMSALFAAIFGPVAEEIFFRGFMYPAVKKSVGVFGSLLITSAIFSLLHAHTVGFFPIMALGMLLAYLYEKTGSLVSCIAVHIMHNVAMLFLVFFIRLIGV